MGVDVLVLGGGPAGAIAALALARAGARVKVLDRAAFPRDKLCGDTINPGALGVLSRLGLSGATEGGLGVDGMIVTGEGGVRVTGRYGGGRQGIAIPRRVLDARLVAAAVAAGAVLEERVLADRPIVDAEGRVTGVEVLLSSGRRERYTARVTIAADGRYSRVARALRLTRCPEHPRRWAVGALFAGVPRLSAFGEMHVRPGRYLGVAPLPGGFTNACLVTADRATLGIPGVLLKALQSDPQTEERFARAEMVSPPVVLGPLALDAGGAGTHGLLLAGDASGFIDPMTGDGLRFALRGGELAAEHALGVLAGGWQGAHLRLAAARRREFAAKWRFNRALRALVSSSAAVRAAGMGASLSPALLRRTIRYAGDVSLA